MNFLFMCFAIVNFIKKNEKDIIKDSTKFINKRLADIVSIEYNTYSRNHHLLRDFLSYYDNRKHHFHKKTAAGDFIALEDEFEYYGRLDWFRKKDTNKKEVGELSKNSEKPKERNIQINYRIQDRFDVLVDEIAPPPVELRDIDNDNPEL